MAKPVFVLGPGAVPVQNNVIPVIIKHCCEGIGVDKEDVIRTADLIYTRKEWQY